jgi:hypothetical protein
MKYPVSTISTFPTNENLLEETSNKLFVWILIVAFGGFSFILASVGAGKILNILYPFSCLLLGFILYSKSPVEYVGFCWWICFLTPFLRRIADFQSGYTEPSPILLAPYLIILATIPNVWKYFSKLTTQQGIPFLLVSIGIIYSFMIGVVTRQPFPVFRGLLDWICPLLFGIHLWLNWRDYPKYHKMILNVFTLGILVMGSYGIYQYLVAPGWDSYWLINSGLISSHGKGEPMDLRVWSTLNSAESFAGIMAPGLLLLFNNSSALVFPASVVGYISFLLSLVRTGWLGWGIGFLSLMTNLKPKTQFRLLLTVIAMLILTVPLINNDAFSETINQRLITLTDMENDNSAIGRQEIYSSLISAALVSFVGQGLGGDTFDSAILSMLINLGWIGTLPYISGLVLLLAQFFKISDPTAKSVAIGYRAAIISVLVRLPFNSSTQGTSGMVLWGFLAMGLAAERYYTELRLVQEDWLTQMISQEENDDEIIYSNT